MLLFIHGFGSSGHGSKAEQLRSFCAEQGIAFAAPSLPNIPVLALDTLEELLLVLLRHESVTLIGSSLGGFYTTWLAHRFNLPYVLINPAVEPYITLHRAVGKAVHFHDQTAYEWTAAHTESLRAYQVAQPATERCLLMLQTGDELLDYRQALDVYPGAELILEEGGNHGFEGFERHLSYIQQWHQKQQLIVEKL